jgi:hypothetical protein
MRWGGLHVPTANEANVGGAESHLKCRPEVDIVRGLAVQRGE